MFHIWKPKNVIFLGEMTAMSGDQWPADTGGFDVFHGNPLEQGTPKLNY